jgi:hypothetical protein
MGLRAKCQGEVYTTSQGGRVEMVPKGKDYKKSKRA